MKKINWDHLWYGNEPTVGDLEIHGAWFGVILIGASRLHSIAIYRALFDRYSDQSRSCSCTIGEERFSIFDFGSECGIAQFTKCERGERSSLLCIPSRYISKKCKGERKEKKSLWINYLREALTLGEPTRMHCESRHEYLSRMESSIQTQMSKNKKGKKR